MNHPDDDRQAIESDSSSPIDQQLAAPPASVPATSPAATSPGNRGEVMELMDRPWMIVLLLLHVGFLGIPIYWKTKYSVSTRLWIIVASIVYTVGAVLFIYLTLRWIASVLGF